MAATDRRAIIKSRFVVLRRAGVKSVATHLRYIEREGVTRDGQRGQAYGPVTDSADLNAFEERGREDRHQFRLIVSVEGAEQLEDLRGFTRDLMRQVSVDLETELDWVAVDHWDTDNPHTHVVLRGRCADGQDLVISPDYIGRGMRLRATEIATEWLGPRSQLEIQQSLAKEVEQQRFTSLDRMLLRYAKSNSVDVDELRNERRALQLRGRLARLQAMDLAREVQHGRWELSAEMEATLRSMGDRGDIVRAMNKALRGRTRELDTDANFRSSLLGVVLDKGIREELDDRGFLVIDGMDGRAHYVPLPASSELSDFPIGSVVKVAAARSATGRSARAGDVPSVTLESHLTVQEQITARGATWIDRQLLEPSILTVGQGFGLVVKDAMRQRAENLLAQGLAENRAGIIRLRPGVIAVLRDRDLKAAGEMLRPRLGKAYRHEGQGMDKRAVVRGAILLDSGKFAIVENEKNFTLVPWNRSIERHQGAELLRTPSEGAVRGVDLRRQLGR